MSSSRINEPDEVQTDKIVDVLGRHGYRVYNITDNGIVLVNDNSPTFKDVVIIPAGMGDGVPSSVIKKNIEDSSVTWNDILLEL